MATNKVVTVTTVPTRTGDTVASYNVYTGATLLGTMTTGEAAVGKTFSLTDGVSHSISVKTVWTTYGESTTNTSNVVVVDLTTPVVYGLQLGTLDKNVLEAPHNQGGTIEYEWYAKTFTGESVSGYLAGPASTAFATAGFVGMYKENTASSVRFKVQGTAASLSIAHAFPQTGGQDKIRLVRTPTGGQWYLNDVAKDDYDPTTGFVDLAAKMAFGGYFITSPNYRCDYILHTLRIKKDAGAWETFNFGSPTTISTSKVSFTGSLGSVLEFGSNAPAVDIHAAIVTI